MKLLNARLIDSGAVREGVDIEIEGNLIKSVTDAQPAASHAPENPQIADTHDLSGYTVLPGLINLHIHLLFDATPNPEANMGMAAPMQALKAAKRVRGMLDAGITTTRDLGGVDYIEMSIKKGINEGWLPGPRYLVSGKLVTMTGGHGYFAGIEVDGVDEARKAARYNIKMGADCIKMMATGGVMTAGVDPNSVQLTEDELRGGFSEAIKAGKLTATHAVAAAGIKNAVRAGARTVEHGILLDDEAIQLMIEYGAFLSATLSAPYFIAEFGVAAGIPAFMVEKSKRLIDQHIINFARAYKAGVKIGCGSDSGTPMNHHNDLVTELKLMNNAGMSVLEVLNAATVTSADALKMDDRVGSLTPGKFADLIAVRTDPLTDLEVLRQPHLVIKDGKVYVSKVEGLALSED